MSRRPHHPAGRRFRYRPRIHGERGRVLGESVSLRKVREHKAGWIHFIGNAAVLALAFASWVLRLGDPSDAVVPLGIMLSVSWTAILAITGWYGGELSYRHGVGVTGE